MCFCRYFVSLSQVRYEHPYQQNSGSPCKWTAAVLRDLICGHFLCRVASRRTGTDRIKQTRIRIKAVK